MVLRSWLVEVTESNHIKNVTSLTHQELLAQVQAVVRERMVGQTAGHGIDHVLRVHRIAKELQATEGGDLLIIELAALLHDVGDAKFHDGIERSGEFAIEILGAFQLPDVLVQQVAMICDQISFRKSVAADQLSLEARIVQDADRLEALGAMGSFARSSMEQREPNRSSMPMHPTPSAV